MELLHNGYTLALSEGAFPLSTDSVLLSGFLRLSSGANVLDLGSGCATLGLLLCARNQSCRVTGVEIDPLAHEAALENISRNGLSHRLSSICEDIANVSSLFPPGSFSACMTNPPYFSAGPAGNHTNARREDLCDLTTLLRSAAWALKYGGDLFIVYRPERLAELIAEASAWKLEPKRLQLVRHRPGAPVSLVLLQCRKGAKPGLIWEELCLHKEDGTPSDAYRELYHMPPAP